MLKVSDNKCGSCCDDLMPDILSKLAIWNHKDVQLYPNSITVYVDCPSCGYRDSVELVLTNRFKNVVGNMDMKDYLTIFRSPTIVINEPKGDLYE